MGLRTDRLQGIACIERLLFQDLAEIEGGVPPRQKDDSKKSPRCPPAEAIASPIAFHCVWLCSQNNRIKFFPKRVPSSFLDFAP
jgi:hypothetical protein